MDISFSLIPAFFERILDKVRKEYGDNAAMLDMDTSSVLSRFFGPLILRLFAAF